MSGILFSKTLGFFTWFLIVLMEKIFKIHIYSCLCLAWLVKIYCPILTSSFNLLILNCTPKFAMHWPKQTFLCSKFILMLYRLSSAIFWSVQCVCSYYCIIKSLNAKLDLSTILKNTSILHSLFRFYSNYYHRHIILLFVSAKAFMNLLQFFSQVYHYKYFCKIVKYWCLEVLLGIIWMSGCRLIWYPAQIGIYGEASEEEEGWYMDHRSPSSCYFWDFWDTMIHIWMNHGIPKILGLLYLLPSQHSFFLYPLNFFKI